MDISPNREARDMAVLQAVVTLDEASRRILEPDQIASHLGWSIEDVQQSLLHLASGQPPYADFRVSLTSGAAREVLSVTSPTERALRATNVWTSAETALNRIADALEAMIAQASTDDERTRLQRTLDWLRGGGRDTMVQAIGVGLQIGAAGMGLVLRRRVSLCPN